MARRDHFSRRILCAVLAGAVASVVGSVRGDAMAKGDVSPADLSKWVYTQYINAYIGDTGAGSLTVTSVKTLTSYYSYLGNTASGNGTVEVNGTGAIWSTGIYLYVGKQGTGVLTIANGGRVENGNTAYLGYGAGASGTVTVDGAGSMLTGSFYLRVGQSGSGVVTVTDGGEVNSSGAIVGYDTGSSGTLTLDGTGSRWLSGSDIYVGRSGTGVVAVTGGGVVSNPYEGYIGNNAGASGTVTVDGAGSRWSNRDLYVGRSGTGILDITNGGAVSGSRSGFVGYDTGASGTVTVDGTGSTWTCGSNLSLGWYGTGLLNITNGGVVNVSGTLSAAKGATLTGSVSFGGHGGTLVTGYYSALREQITGTGTLIAHGLIFDESLTFDGVQGLNHTWKWTGDQQNVTVNLTPNNGSFGVLGAGNVGSGAMTIQDAVAVISSYSCLGNNAGSSGTATVNGTGSTWTCNGYFLMVGNYGTGVLNITGGGTVSLPWSSGKGYVGYGAGSTGTVTVDGTASKWTVGDNIIVGASGTGVLNITNGGSVVGNSKNDQTYIGSAAGSSGTVTVDGSGSILTCASTLIIGNSGAGVLNITNGGLVNASGPTYMAYNAGSTGAIHFGDNGGTLTTTAFWGALAQITGTGTINTQGVIYDDALVIDSAHGSGQTLAWTSDQANVTVNLTASNSGAYKILGAGYLGAGTLTIRDGAVVKSLDSYLGYLAGSSGKATVDGTSSKWTCVNALYVGNYGTGELAITHGGSVGSGGTLFLGNMTGSAGTVTVDGAGSNLTTSQYLYVGYSGAGMMGITDGGRVTTRYGNLGYNSGSAGTVTVDGTGSLFTCNANGGLTVGYSGRGVLAITNGGAVSSPSGNISSASAVMVDGTGSTWTCSGWISVSGALNITNGGLAVASESTTIASGGSIQFGDHGGTLTTGFLWGLPAQVTGAGTININGLIADETLLFDDANGINRTWTWTGDQTNVTVNLTAVNGTFGTIGAGYAGTGALTIREGVAVKSGDGYLGYSAGSSGTGTVEGAGSTWTCSGNLTVGQAGTGVLSISNNGSVNCADSVYLGYSADASGTVTVDGTGTKMTSSWGVAVGYSGTGLLAISHGGTVTGGNGVLANNESSSGMATVDGIGSKWACNSALYVGQTGAGTLAITNGGGVSCALGFVGYNSRASGTVTVDGTGSTLTSTNSLTVGNNGTGALNVTRGGTVSAALSVIGSSGTVIVDGAGSRWTTSGTLTVGNLGMGTMMITNGGSVTNNLGFVGQSAVGSGAVLVDGVGSMWACSGSLLVGYAGPGVLEVRHGGVVSSAGGCLGNSTSSYGEATVDGAGSKWMSSGSLTMGYSGAGSLGITNGGSVNCTMAILGFNGRSSGSLTVDGTGSACVVGGVTIGYFGAGVLAITRGGSLSLPNNGGGGNYQAIGLNAGASGMVTVDGAGSTWACGSSDIYVGKNGVGVLRISSGGAVSTVAYGYVGCTGGRGSSGVATVDGVGSIWASGGLTIGSSGAGTLNITNGGLVNAKGSTTLSKGPTLLPNGTTSNGMLCFGLYGGTLTTGSFFGSPTQVKGMGTININGLVSDGSLVFDAVHGVDQMLAWTGDQTNVTVNLTGKSGSLGYVGVGYLGTGTLTVQDGVKVPSYAGVLGYNSGSSGTATVDGAGSTWACWGSLAVGSVGTGALKVVNGGTVTAGSVSVNNSSLVAMAVGDGSKLSAGTGPLTNNGAIRLAAVPSATVGAYTPIVAGSWLGTGAVTALGGKWDAGSHVFTVSAAQEGAAGVGVVIDRLAQQRVVITDGTTLDSVVAGFMGTTSSSNLTLTGWELTAEQEAALVGRLPAGTAVLEGWTFATEGYTAGEAVYLSMEVGSGWSAEQLSVWHLGGGGWVPFGVGDMSYDGAYASFTVNGFSGYAVTGVPEAGTLGVLLLGVVGVMGRRKCRIQSA